MKSSERLGRQEKYDSNVATYDSLEINVEHGDTNTI